jgi:peptide/nickel transport system ATP-binding protein
MRPNESVAAPYTQGQAVAAHPALDVQELATSFFTPSGEVQAVDGVTFALQRGKRLAIVGESGSGKSVTALSIMGLVPPPGRVVQGEVLVNGRSVLAMSDRSLRKLRGSEVAMIFQDPMTSLNPVHTIGSQIVEMIRLHRPVSRTEAEELTVDLLRSVHIPQPETRLNDYPHQFSGGMRQRVMIAMALANNPAVLIADEPTTALDVTTQAQILELLDELCQVHNAAVLLITHNLGVVSGFCDRVIVMYGGRVMEAADNAELFGRPLHPYTLGLLGSLPKSDTSRADLTPIPGEPPDPRALPEGCVFFDRCTVRRDRCRLERPALRRLGAGRYIACHFVEDDKDKKRFSVGEQQRTATARDESGGVPTLEVLNLVKHFPMHGGYVSAVEDVSFQIAKGKTFALVGESGSGKTTTAMMALRLLPATSGSIRFQGQNVCDLAGRDLRVFRRRTQIVFQDPYSSLDPRMNIRDIVTEPMLVQRIGNRRTRTARAVELLEMVGLHSSYIHRYPHQFSGGQRQRIGIARALALDPTLLVCDEPVSALDVSVQAQVLNLLRRLQRELGLTYLFIAHDLSVVRYVADQVAVMYLGKIVEMGTMEELFAHPGHPYTLALLSASPIVDVEQTMNRLILTGEIPSALNPPSGCRFRTRCPIAEGLCAEREPEHKRAKTGQLVACHFVDDAVTRVRDSQP